MKAYRVKDYRAYATSAMREAHNNQIILDQIRVRTGLNVRIISNSEQRFISYKAIAAKASEFNKIIQKGTAIVDVGFGSAQLSLFDKDSLVTTQNLLSVPCVCAAFWPTSRQPWRNTGSTLRRLWTMSCSPSARCT